MILATLLLFATIRITAVVVGIAAFGLPALFLLYLWFAGVLRDLPRAALPMVSVLGAVLGTCWARAAGQFASRDYGTPMELPPGGHTACLGIAVSLAGAVLMALPTLLARALPSSARESLDGFVIGIFAALSFAAGATVTRQAVQFQTGFIPHSRPRLNVIVEAVLCGATIPLTAAAAGGTVGLALWFGPRADQHGRPRYALWGLVGSLLLGYALIGIVDAAGFSQLGMLTLHLLVTAAAIQIMRAALQIGLMHESPDAISLKPLLCEHCAHVVPDAQFCPACGVATRASSKASRRLRRSTRPVPVATAVVIDVGHRRFPAVALPEQIYEAPAIRNPRVSAVMVRWTVAILPVAAVLLTVNHLVSKPAAPYLCPPQCGRPPGGAPVTALPVFSPRDGSFSVSYPAAGSLYEISTADSGVTARLTAGDGGVMQLFGEPANGRGAREVVHAALRRAYPDASVAYEIPNAMVGYQHGYGVAADDWPQSSSGPFRRIRTLVLAAVKDDLALIAFATGPERAFGPDFGPGPPSGANLQLAQDMGKYINSFRWRGDPPR